MHGRQNRLTRQGVNVVRLKPEHIRRKTREKLIVKGQEANVRLREWRGKKVVERRGYNNDEGLENEGLPYYCGLQRFYAHKLAYLLFPEHFFNPLVQEGVEGKFEREVTLRSKPKFGDRLYEHYLNHFYDRKKFKSGWFVCVKCEDHERRVCSDRVIKLWRVLQHAGINVNGHSVNIGFRNGTPVFFELTPPGLDSKAVCKHLEGLTDEKLKKKALKYLERYMSIT